MSDVQTVFDNLAAINTGLGSLASDLTTVKTKLDGIAALVQGLQTGTVSQAQLDEISSQVSGVASTVGTIATSVSAIVAEEDTINPAA